MSQKVSKILFFGRILVIKKQSEITPNFSPKSVDNLVDNFVVLCENVAMVRDGS